MTRFNCLNDLQKSSTVNSNIPLPFWTANPSYNLFIQNTFIDSPTVKPLSAHLVLTFDRDRGFTLSHVWSWWRLKWCPNVVCVFALHSFSQLPVDFSHHKLTLTQSSIHRPDSQRSHSTDRDWERLVIKDLTWLSDTVTNHALNLRRTLLNDEAMLFS